MASGAEGGRRRTGICVRRECRPDRHSVAAAADERSRHRLQGPAHARKLAGGYFRGACERAEGGAMSVAAFNTYGVWAIYRFEMARALRTWLQSIVTPVITTSLYFIVFGSAMGSKIGKASCREKVCQAV